MRTYTFEANDKTYTLKYNYNAICELEEASGKPLQALFAEDAIGLSTIRLLLWAGLKWHNNGVTKQQVGFIIDDLVERKTYEEVTQNAVKLLTKSFGGGDGEGEL